jgi:hypothetical protein
MHAFLEVHDTPLSDAPCVPIGRCITVPAGLGVRRILHLAPSQRSTSVTRTFALLL